MSWKEILILLLAGCSLFAGYCVIMSTRRGGEETAALPAMAETGEFALASGDDLIRLVDASANDDEIDELLIPSADYADLSFCTATEGGATIRLFILDDKIYIHKDDRSLVFGEVKEWRINWELYTTSRNDVAPLGEKAARRCLVEVLAITQETVQSIIDLSNSMK